MLRNRIVDQNEDYTNRIVAKIYLYCAGICAFAILSRYIGITSTEEWIMWRDFGLSTLLMCFPFTLYFIFHKTGPWFKYLNVFSFIAMMILLYGDFEINRFVFIAWIFPALIACLYFDRSLTLITVLAITASINIIDFINGASIFTGIAFDFEKSRNYVAIKTDILRDTLFIDLNLGIVFGAIYALANRTRRLLSDLIGAEEKKTILERMSDLMQEASQVSSVLVESAKCLSEIASESAKTNEQSSQYAQSMAASAKSTMNLVQDSNPLLIRMADRVQDIAKNINELNQIANLLNNVTTDGSKAIDFATREMRTITDASLESKAVMAELSGISYEIEKIIQTITGIAKQTNLLALNASIEAFRAGEHGRSFQVVAFAIRELASQSANATQDIKKLVTAIRGKLALAENSILREANLAEDGLSVITEAGKAFTEISATGKILTDQVEQILYAIQEIAADSAQVVTSAIEIEQYAHTELSNAENIATAAIQQLAGTEELLAQADNVYNMANDLHKLGSGEVGKE